MTKKEFFEFFEENHIVDKYSQLCLKFNDFDNKKHPKKEDVMELLKEWDIELKYSQRVKTPIYRNGVRFICEELNPESIDKLEYPYPFSTSDEDLSEILDFYLNLYVKFKKTFLI